LKFEYNLFHKRDDVYIDKDETLYGDLILVDTDAEVSGKVDGDIILLSSFTYISENAAIDGHVINCSGDLDRDDLALITGVVLDDEEEEEEYLYYEDEDEDDLIRDEVEKKYLQKKEYKDKDIVRFFGDVIIEENEVMDGDVVIMKGSASVKGEVDGDIVAIFGNIDLDSTGYVMGDVVSVGGKIYREPGSYVGGDVVQTTWTGQRVDDRGRKYRVEERDEDRDEDWDEWRDRNRLQKYMTQWDNEDIEADMENVLFNYNRVEGLVLGVQIPQNLWIKNSKYNVRIYGHAAYAFKSKATRYQIGLERWLFEDFRFTLGVESHDMLDSEDDWIIPEFENTLAALFLGEDFRDYYRRSGVSVYAIQNVTHHFRMMGGLKKDRFYSVKKETNWSIFGGNKKFLDNPMVDEFEIKSIVASVGLDTRNDLVHPNEGWFINVNGEFARPNLNDNSIYNFDRLIIDLRRYQPLGYGENLDFRFRLGTGRGDLPLQYRYDLGGLSSLRGYKFKEFKDGDRMLLGNIEYRIYGSFMDLFDLPDLNIILFGDAGWVWNAEDNSQLDNSFDDITWNEMMTNVGVAFSNYEGNVRLNIAQRLDDRSKPVVVTFRLRRAF